MTRCTRFAGVGAMGFLVQLAVLYLLTSRLHVPSIVAVAFAVEVAILHNFVWHERWTWRDRVAHSSGAAVAERLWRFNAASGAVSLLGNVAFTALFVAFHAPVLIANIAAVGCLTVINYLVADRLAYRAPSAGGLEVAPPTRALPIRRSFFTWIVVGGALAGGATLEAAQPAAETIAAWDRYVGTVEGRRAREANDADRFLAVDFDPQTRRADLVARLRRGEVVVENVSGGTVDLGGGTVSHWRGVIFVPWVSLSDVLNDAALKGRMPDRQEDVLAARVISRDGDSLRLFLKLQRRAIVTATYNTEHLVRYQRLGVARGESRSVSTRIAEVRDVATPREAEQPAGQDRGFLWRLHSYWRYQAAPGGVIVELESLTLSRDIPWAIRLMAGSIVERIARESVSRTLTALRARVLESTAD